MQDVDGVGPVFVSTKMSFENSGFPRTANGFMKIMNSEFKGEVQVAAEHYKRKPFIPMLTRRRIAHQIYIFKISDV